MMVSPYTTQESEECPLHPLMAKRAEDRRILMAQEDPKYLTVRVNEGCLACKEMYPGKGDPECEHYQVHMEKMPRFNGNGKKKESRHATPEELGDVVETAPTQGLLGGE